MGIEAREQTLAASLAGHAHVTDEVVRSRTADAPGRHAAIAVAEENATILVDRDFVEIEKVAIGLASALLPDTCPALHWVIGRGVDRHPVFSLVVGRRDECVPFPGEADLLIITAQVCPNETDAGSPGASTDGFNLDRVGNAMGRTDVGVVQPGNLVGGVIEL